MEDCPPPLVYFEVDRSTVDDVTTSVGHHRTPTRLIVVEYRDNRESYERQIWLQGQATLTNGRLKSNIIRYRHTIKVDPWFVPVIPDDSPVCFDSGKLVGYWEARLGSGESVTIDIGWSVDIYDRADFNQDGLVDAVDLGILLAAWGRYDVGEDLDQNGVVNGEDLGWFFTRWSKE